MRTPSVVLLLALASLAASTAHAEDDLVVPVAGASLALDGRPDEPAWRAGATPTIGAHASDAAPRVRLLLSGERLWVAVDVDEAPGPGVGLVLMLAPEGTETAADALAVSFAPQSMRAPRWVVQGPRGAGRAIYRLEGAVDVAAAGRWSAEVALPLEDLKLADPKTPLRLAVVVKTRAPSQAVWAPPGAAYRGPATWTRLLPAGAWPQGAVEIDPVASAEADRRDDDRLYAWATFGAAYQAKMGDLLTAAGHPFGVIGEDGNVTVLETLRDLLVRPLEQVHELRPDLAFAHVVRGGVLHQMGLADEAREAFEKGITLMPGLREARFGLHLDVLGPALAAGPVGGPTDYASAFAAAAGAAQQARAEDFAAEGAAFGTALLHLAHGDFAEALALLEPLAMRYPFQLSLDAAAARGRVGHARWPREQRYRQVEAERDDLPRVRLATARGDVVLELYEDDANNTVKNFVWLVTHGFYDGSTVARTVPFLLAEVGAGDPGWAVATQRPPDRQRIGASGERRRLPWRGTLVMLSATPDAAAARFAILTGSAPDLESDLIPFGRVVSGLDAVDALEAGDRMEKAVVVRTRPGTEYRPLTLEGTPAPTPR